MRQEVAKNYPKTNVDMLSKQQLQGLYERARKDKQDQQQKQIVEATINQSTPLIRSQAVSSPGQYEERGSMIRSQSMNHVQEHELSLNSDSLDHYSEDRSMQQEQNWLDDIPDTLSNNRTSFSVSGAFQSKPALDSDEKTFFLIHKSSEDEARVYVPEGSYTMTQLLNRYSNRLPRRQ